MVPLLSLNCSTLLCYFVSAAPEHQNPLFKIYVVRPEDWLVNKYYVNVHITRERERERRHNKVIYQPVCLKIKAICLPYPCMLNTIELQRVIT